MTKGLEARASVTIKAPAARVWEALTKPEIIKQYFFGTDVATDWKVGSPIYWRGIWEGRPYEDKGSVLEVRPLHSLVVTHWSALSGVPDVPENQHTLSFLLVEEGDNSLVTIVQDNNASEEEAGHSSALWRTLLDSLKALLEGATPPS